MSLLDQERKQALARVGVSESMRAQELELLVMAHRYLYYIQCSPVLADRDYDFLDEKAAAVCPKTSPVHQVGSDMESSYSEVHIAKAREIWMQNRGDSCPF